MAFVPIQETQETIRETTAEPDRLAAVRDDKNRIVIVGVISNDLSDGWVRVRTHDGCCYAVAKRDLVFLDVVPS